MKRRLLIYILILWCSFVFSEENKINSLKKPAVNSTKYFDINRITCSIRNDGVFARHPIRGISDFRFDENYVIYTSGLWLAGKVNDEIRASIAEYNTDWVGGIIDTNGNPYGKQDTTFRVYKITRSDNASNNPDYAEWPIDFGAPSDDQRNPLFFGDQTFWCSSTDAYLENRDINICPPLDTEVHLTVWGWKEIDNIMFLRWKIANKSNQVWNDIYFGVFSDPDLRFPPNDLTGSDSTMNLVYAYVSTEDQSISKYNSVGYVMLESPIVPSVGDTAFTIFGRKLNYMNVPVSAPIYRKANFPGWMDISYPNERTAEVIYNRLRCIDSYGNHAIDPTTGRFSNWAYSGDPILKTGWLDTLARDRRMMLSVGPFQMEPGDTNSMTCAIIPVKNDFRLGNIFDVKQNAQALQHAVKNDAGIYSVARIVTVKNCSFETPIMLLNFKPVKEVQFRIQFDTTEINYGGLMLSDRTLPNFSLDSDFVEEGTIEYILKSKGEKNIDIGNGPVVNLNFAIRDGIRENMIYLKLDNASCLLDNDQRFSLNNTGCLIYNNIAGTDVKFSNENDQISFDLYQNYPNPFNPTTTIRFSNDEPSKVNLKIYNIQGQLVKVLVDEFKNSGEYSAFWDGTCSSGNQVISGLYFYQLKAGDKNLTKKMLLLK